MGFGDFGAEAIKEAFKKAASLIDPVGGVCSTP
jgi:hypothetical protein